MEKGREREEAAVEEEEEEVEEAGGRTQCRLRGLR